MLGTGPLLDRACLAQVGEEEAEILCRSVLPDNVPASRVILPTILLENRRPPDPKAHNLRNLGKGALPFLGMSHRIIQSEYHTEKTISKYLLGLTGKRQGVLFLTRNFLHPLRGSLRCRRVNGTSGRLVGAEQPLSHGKGLWGRISAPPLLVGLEMLSNHEEGEAKREPGVRCVVSRTVCS